MRTRRLQFSSNPVPSHGHIPVLLHEAVDMLALKESDVAVDATFGGGGHAHEIAQKLGSCGKLYAFDLDSDAIERAKELFNGDARIHLIQANFRELEAELTKKGVTRIDAALFDLGWSGYQLSAGRGFSFLSDEPLSMAYGKEQPLTAAAIVNGWSEESLADVIYGWGEERYSRRIAKAIHDAREKKPISTSRELGEIVKAAYPVALRNGRLHPATKTFQALRIAVNDELGALKDGIRGAWKLLSPGGRISVITFHSIEDREVKRLFLELAKEGGERITKRPIQPADEEVKANPRARSAKLRVIQKDL